jgi:hypothetical protein
VRVSSGTRASSCRDMEGCGSRPTDLANATGWAINPMRHRSVACGIGQRSSSYLSDRGKACSRQRRISAPAATLSLPAAKATSSNRRPIFRETNPDQDLCKQPAPRAQARAKRVPLTTNPSLVPLLTNQCHRNPIYAARGQAWQPNRNCRVTRHLQERKVAGQPHSF